MLSETCGFDSGKCVDILNTIDDKILYTLTTSDIIEETFEKAGIKFDVDEVGYRITVRC